jgi:predicted PurR-regulated permease PerM
MTVEVPSAATSEEQLGSQTTENCEEGVDHMNGTQRTDRIVAIAVATLLTAGCIVVLYPFVSALLWAVILCFVTWPTFLWGMRLLGGRRTLAAILMALLVAVLLVAPFVALGLSLADNVTRLTAVVSGELEHGLPAPPAWVADIPLVGHRLHTAWQALTLDSSRLTTALQNLVIPVSTWLLSQGVALAAGVLYLSLSVLLLFFLYRDGAALATGLQEVARRIAGARAQQLVELAVHTVRGVVYGILGSLLAQGILAGIGFLVAGVPGAFLLGFLTLILSILPGGPALLWLPASIWLYKQGATGWAIFLVLWGLLVVGTADNVIKPYLIGRGSDLPFILVLLGVLGGAFAFGVIGIFLGPTLLAVGYTVVRDWALAEPVAAAAAPGLEQG